MPQSHDLSLPHNVSPTKSILITGGSSGIGAALALYYAAPNVKLILTGQNEKRLQEVAQSCAQKGALLITKIIDVRDQKAMREWILQCGPLDLVFANAGISIGGLHPTDQHYEQASREIFDVNLIGVLNTLHPAVDVMRHQNNKPQIAIVSSLAGYRGLPASPAYSASKAAVKAYSEALTPNLAEVGIQLSTIFPGFVKSRITDKNNFPMPFFMSAEKAAAYIARGIEKRKTIISFPFPMRASVWLMRILPSALAIKLLSKQRGTKA